MAAPKNSVMTPLNPMAPTSSLNLEMVPLDQQKQLCFYNGEKFGEGDFLQTNDGPPLYCRRMPDGTMGWQA